MVSLTLDKELAAVMAAAAQPDQPPPPPVTDVAMLRATTDAGLQFIFSRMPECPSVRRSEFEAAGGDGAPVSLLWYEKANAPKGPAVVYAHGGGMVSGSAEIYDPLMRFYVELSGVSFLSVDYRLAPEFSEAGLAQDMFSALKWMKTNGGALGVDPTRIAMMGDSGGGGVAAGACLLARDAGIAPARQILVYPMLDDRTLMPDPLLEPLASWTCAKNRIAWEAILGEHFGSDHELSDRAPARAASLEGLPPTYIDVGELDIFRDECTDYARRLHASGVSCELHIYPGAPHAFDWIDLNLQLSIRAFANRARVLSSL